MNNFFKKAMLFLLLIIACFILAACGGGGGSSSTDNPVNPDPPISVKPKAKITGYIAFGETATSAGAPAYQASSPIAVGALVNNAGVELRKADNYNTIISSTTSSNGKFCFSGLDAGNYIITAKYTDSSNVLKSETFIKIEANKYDYYLDSTPIELFKTAALKINVKDETGAAIENALVTLDKSRSDYTSTDGTISFNEVPRGMHEINISKYNYVNKSDYLSVYDTNQSITTALVSSASNLSALNISEITAATQSATLNVTGEGTLELLVSSDNPNNGALAFNWSCSAGTFADQNQSADGARKLSRISWKAPAINWPASQSYAYHNISVTVNDGRGYQSVKSARVKIIKSGATFFNITSTPAVTVLDLQQQFTYQITSSISSTLTYEKLDGPADLTLSSTGAVSYAPNAYGEFGVIIKISEPGGFFQLHKFMLNVAKSIPRPAAGSFSKTVLKPGSGLATILKDFGPGETLVAFGYNTSASNNSYSISTYAFNQSSTAASATPNAPRPSLQADERLTALATSDARMREGEKFSAREREANGSLAASKAPGSQKAPQIGDTQSFYSLNSLTWPPYESTWTLVNAKLVAIGEHCYLYEDNETPSSYLKLTSTDIENFKNSFDSEIYPRITQTFGSEPNPGIDNDARIYILFTYNVNRQSASGYFDSTNQLTQAVIESSANYNKNTKGYKYHSNEKEMLYMAVPSASQNHETFFNNTLGVIAHEFQHLINWNQHSSKNPDLLEESWLNEGLSQLAQDVAGYGYQRGTLSFIINPYLKSPESYSLTNFKFGLGYYGAAYLFVRYLVDRGATPMNLVKSSKVGKANALDEIRRIGVADTFDNFFEDYIVTLYLSNLGVTSDSRYNFQSINIRATQNDGTLLSGFSLSKSLLAPSTYESDSLSEYAASAIKCQSQTSNSYKFVASDKSDNGIGIILLRIVNN